MVVPLSFQNKEIRFKHLSHENDFLYKQNTTLRVTNISAFSFYSIFICFYVLFLGEAGETLMNDGSSVAEKTSSHSFHDHSYAVSGFLWTK